MSLTYSNVLTAIGIGFTIIVGVWRVLPQLSGASRGYYTFLLVWTVPYMIGQASQEDEWGFIWVQYHLVDLTYIQSSTAFGGALYVAICWCMKRRANQTGIFLSMLALYYISIVVSFTGEIWDTCWAWVAHGSLLPAIDAIDYLAFTAGLAIVVAPAFAFPRLYTDALAIDF